LTGEGDTANAAILRSVLLCGLQPGFALSEVGRDPSRGCQPAASTKQRDDSSIAEDRRVFDRPCDDCAESRCGGPFEEAHYAALREKSGNGFLSKVTPEGQTGIMTSQIDF
jgi:hypothetical protein